MQLRSQNRHRSPHEPRRGELSLNVSTTTAVVSTTSTSTNNHSHTSNGTTDTSWNEVVATTDTTTNHHGRRRRRMESNYTNMNTEEIVVRDETEAPQAIPIVSSSPSSTTSSTGSNATGSHSSGIATIPSVQRQPQQEPRHRNRPRFATGNHRSRSAAAAAATTSFPSPAAASGERTVAEDTIFLVDHPAPDGSREMVDAATGMATTSEPATPVEPSSLSDESVVVPNATTIAAPHFSSLVLPSQLHLSPPTSPPVLFPPFFVRPSHSIRTHQSGNRGSSASHDNSRSASPPTFMDRPHPDETAIRSPPVEQQQAHDPTRHGTRRVVHRERQNRRGSCSTLSPPPPPQSRRTSLTLSSFNGLSNHNSDSSTTTNSNNNGGENNSMHQNNYQRSSIQDRINRYRNIGPQSHQQINTAATTTPMASNSLDELPLFPIPPFDVRFNFANSGTTATAATNTEESAISSTAYTASSGVTSSEYPNDAVLPPLPFFESAPNNTTVGSAPNVASSQASITSTAATMSLTPPPLPRRSSARLAAVVAQKIQRQKEEVAEEALDRSKPPATSRNSSNKKRPPKSNDDKDIFVVDDDDCDNDKKRKAREMCCICMSFPDDANEPMATLSNCVHEFCTHCIMKWADTENSCPLCKQRFTSVIIHRRSKNCNSETIENQSEAPISKKKAKISASRSRRGGSPHKSSKPYQKIVIQVPTRNQRSEAGMVLDTILQSLTTTNGIIAATANLVGEGGSVNLNPFVSFNIGLHSTNDYPNPYQDFIAAARASFTSGSVRSINNSNPSGTGNDASLLVGQPQQLGRPPHSVAFGATGTGSIRVAQPQQQGRPPHTFIFGTGTSHNPSTIRRHHQIFPPQDNSVSFSFGQPLHTSTSTDPTNAATTSNQNRFIPAPQSSPQESLFANFLPTTMTRPFQVDNLSAPPRPEQHYHPSSHLQQIQHDEENWGRFFLQFLGNGERNETPQQPSSGNGANIGSNHQNHAAVHSPLESINRSIVTQHQITLLPMGQRRDPERHETSNPYNRSMERNSLSPTSNNNSPGTRTTLYRDIEFPPSITANQNNSSNTHDAPTLSDIDNIRLRQVQLLQQQQQEMDAVFGRSNVQLAPEIEANRRQFMDEYREIQARIARINSENDRDITLTAIVGGHTSETAIEITEEEDGMDDDDVIVLT